MRAMNQAQQIELVRRVLTHVEAKTTDTDASGQPTRLEAAAYADQDRLAREIRVLFGGKGEVPIAIAHGSELPKPGDFLTHDDSGAPLLVVRREDGGLDAFLNVCRHRGTRLEGASRGHKHAFACPYHGWTYGKRGQLVTIPHEQSFGCIDKASRGLVRVPVGQACGLIFVIPSPTPIEDETRFTFDARAWLGTLADDLDGFGLGTGVAHDPRVTERALSWKLAIDIFLESYHLRPTHKETIYPMFFDNIGLVDRVGPHLRNVFPKRSIRELASTPEEDWSLRQHANVLFHLFPNTLVLVQPDHAAVLHVWPVGTRSAKVSSYLVIPAPATTDKAQRYWAANANILYNATNEDFAMGESIQRGFSAPVRANEDIVFGGGPPHKGVRSIVSTFF
jgi:phenylpropionate dioxygenase-like ring-hydroxylating dioxygenase large terminal subunit